MLKNCPLKFADPEQLADLPVERQPEADPGPQDVQVAEQHRQHQPRHRPEEPGVHPGHPRQDPVVGQPHDGDDHAEHDADEHRRDGQQDGAAQALQHRIGEHHAALAPRVRGEDERPLEAVVGDQQVDEHRGQHGQHGDRDPAPGMPDGHGLDRFRPCPPGWTSSPSSSAISDAAGLTAGVVIAPASTPHLARIVLYVPSAISACTAPAIASAKSVWSLRQDVAVRRRVVDVTDQGELAVGLLHRVRAHRRVGQHRVVLAGDHGVGGVALLLVLVDGDLGLARGRALLRPGGDVVDLHGRRSARRSSCRRRSSGLIVPPVLPPTACRREK